MAIFTFDGSKLKDKAMKYFVYWGFVGPDRYDHESYEMREFATAQEVEEFREEVSRDYLCDSDETGDFRFKVIKGRELKVVPKTTVTSWEVDE